MRVIFVLRRNQTQGNPPKVIRTKRKRNNVRERKDPEIELSGGRNGTQKRITV